MMDAQVLVYGTDRKLKDLLEEKVVQAAKCYLRHPRDTAECREMLVTGRHTILVLRIGRHVEEELSLLADVSSRYPDVAVVVVGESAQAPLAGLAWDLGASYVVILPQPPELLTEAVAGLLRTHPE